MIPSNLKSLLANRKKFVDENADILLGQGTSLSSDLASFSDDKKWKDAHFGPKSATGYTGLVNQGATCYLNSLLQTLYMVPEFRQAIYNWDYDALTHGEEIYCLTRQLQLLFASLQFSIQSSITTTSLTRSFGWTTADSFSQQDVQECMMIIFDFILSQCQNSDLSHLVFQLMYSHIKNNITCHNCHVIRGGVDSQRDIQLQVRGFSSLEESLDNYIREEVLEGIFCDRCQGKHDHSKGVIFTSLPTILTLQLKRFDMDYNKFQRIKVNDFFTIPETIDMGKYMQTTVPTIYDLTSVLVHVGSAFSGHYFCYLKEFHNLSNNNQSNNNSNNNDVDNSYFDINSSNNQTFSSRGSWLLFNDSTVTSLSSSDLDIIFSKSDSPSNANNLSTATSSNKTTIPKNNSIVPIASYAYMLLYRKRDSDEPILSNNITDIMMLPEDIMLRIQQENESFLQMKQEREEASSFIHTKIIFGKQCQCFKIRQTKTIRDLIIVAYEYFTSQNDSQSSVSRRPVSPLTHLLTNTTISSTSNMSSTTTTIATTTEGDEVNPKNSYFIAASGELSLYVEDVLKGTTDKLLGEDSTILSTLPPGIFERTLHLESRHSLQGRRFLENHEIETVPLYLVFVQEWILRNNDSNTNDILFGNSNHNSCQHTDDVLASLPIFSAPESFQLPVTITITELLQGISVRYNSHKTEAVDKTVAIDMTETNIPSMESFEEITVCVLNNTDGTVHEVLPSTEIACLSLTSGDTLYIDNNSYYRHRNTLLTYFNTLQNTITITYGFINDAHVYSSSSTVPPHDVTLRYEISLDKRLPILLLKEKIAMKLSLELLSSFRLFIGVNGPEIKDMQQTVESLGLADGSFLQLRYGTPLSPGMYSLRIILQGNNRSPIAAYTITQDPSIDNNSNSTRSQDLQPSLLPLSETESTTIQSSEFQYIEVIINENDTVTQLKSLLLHHHHRDYLRIAIDDTNVNIRLRRCEKSAATGILKPTTALRDCQTIRQAIPALADGTYVIVQTYVQESFLLEDHILIDIHYWNAEKETEESAMVTHKRLMGAEVAFLKTMLFSELKTWIISTNLFSLNETEASKLTVDNLIFVKPFSWQLKGTVLADMMQLNWLTIKQPNNADPLYGPPFRLCDGSILLVADKNKVSELIFLLDDTNDPILHQEMTTNPAVTHQLREEIGFRLFTPSQQAARKAAEVKDAAEKKQMMEAQMKLVYDSKLTKLVNSSFN